MHRTPRSWPEALELVAAHPDALPVAGGTDVMVEVNFGRRRPTATLDLTRVPELREWRDHDDHVVIGAGVPFTELLDRLGERAPALTGAVRTVGSPQIRNRATLGGNLATASPAGDTLPVLVAAGAEIHVESVHGARVIPAPEFFVGPKRTVLSHGELIRAVRMPLPDGPQVFSKIGPRNAMTIAVCSFALVIDAQRRTAGAGIGAAGPIPLRAVDAEQHLTELIARRWDGTAALPAAGVDEFAELAASATRAVDDVRSSARYRHRGVAVLARRCLTWTWENRHSAGRETRCA